MARRLITILIIISCSLLSLSAQKRATSDAQKIKTEQQKAKKEIAENQRKLQSNNRQIKQQMRTIKALDNEIGARDHEIGKLETHISELNSDITATHRQIDSLAAELATLRVAYTRMLRSMQSLQPASSPLSFMLQSQSMNDLFDRMRYVRRLRDFRMHREDEINARARALGVKRDELSAMVGERSTALTQLTDNRARLREKQARADKMVSRLQKEGVNLKSAISRRQKQLDKLNAELNRIIEADRRAREEQQRKAAAAKKKKDEAAAKAAGNKKTATKTTQGSSAKKDEPTQIAEADRRLTGSFESNKGRLLFPVAGIYRIVRGFGRGQYSSKVQTSHVGIDIEVEKGTKARAVFEGVVTNVSHLDGFNTIVVVRHGVYLTVYVNLENVAVKTGQTVKAGQILGSVAPDEYGGSKAVLQFGLRKERQELNPLEWVK